MRDDRCVAGDISERAVRRNDLLDMLWKQEVLCPPRFELGVGVAYQGTVYRPDDPPRRSKLGNVCVLLNMLGFLVFPSSVVVVTAVMLPMWIVSLVLLIRVRVDAQAPG